MRFFFDTDDGGREIVDDLGIELPDQAEAMEQALSLLRDLSHVPVPAGASRVFAVRVRGPGGEALYDASLQVKVDRLG